MNRGENEIEGYRKNGLEVTIKLEPLRLQKKKLRKPPDLTLCIYMSKQQQQK